MPCSFQRGVVSGTCTSSLLRLLAALVLALAAVDRVSPMRACGLYIMRRQWRHPGILIVRGDEDRSALLPSSLLTVGRALDLLSTSY